MHVGPIIAVTDLARRAGSTSTRWASTVTKPLVDGLWVLTCRSISTPTASR